MRHNIELSVSKPGDGGVVCCRRVDIRERLMRLIFGEIQRIWIIIPNNTVDAVHINEVPEGGESNESD